LTIVQSTERYFKGFKVSMTTQVGCATTHDYPSQQTQTATKQYHERELAKVEALVVPAFQHFVSGHHPFRRFLKYLDSERNVQPNPDYGFLTQEDIKDLQWTDQIYLPNLEVNLYIKPNLSLPLKTKLCYDFLLSQTTRKGSDIFKPYVDETSKNFFDNELSSAVTGYFSNFQWRLENILGYIMNHPEALAAAASTKHVDKPDYGFDWNNMQRIKFFRARAIQRLLNGETYGKELVEEAKALGNNEFELFFLIIMASEVQAPELKGILSLFNPELAKHYQELV
jgi:hypothetical protein